MAASDETCEGNPNFAIICSFITKFGDECGVNVSIPYLQQMLEDTKNVHQDLLEIILHLMRRGKKRFNKDKWEKCLVKFCHEYSSVDAWEIERFGFIKSKLSVKLEIFKRLLELQFDANAKFKGEVNKLDAPSLRILPIGKDIDGHAYWYQLDKDYNMRLYRESFNEEDNSWQLLCSTTNDLKNLIESLEKKYSSPNSGNCKDDSSDLKEPKTPPPDMPVPKRENDSEEMTSHLSESKPCTIIIKTEKKESVSHSETSIKTEGCEKTDGASKRPPDDSGLETKSKEVVSMDISESSENDQKPDVSILDSKDISKKNVVCVPEAEPMEVETSKPIEKDSKICDIEMKSVDEVSSETSSAKPNEEQLDQNTTEKSKSPSPTQQTDSINHHKSSKIKLYEKWSNEKKKVENSNSSTLNLEKTPKKLENSEIKVTESIKPPKNLKAPEINIGVSNETSESLEKSETSIIKSDKCSKNLEGKKSVSESSNSSKDVIDKSEQINSTVEKKKDSSALLESSKLSANQTSNLKKSRDNSDSEHIAVDLSKTSRVNVIVQNASSKPSLSNNAKTDSRKSENSLCTNKMNSDSVGVVKKQEPVVLSMRKFQETAMDLKCSPYNVDSDKMYKSNQTFSKSYDVSVITNASSNTGFSHLQALQNMCESNAMGGIPSVIQSTNQCKSESNKTTVSESNLNSSTDYADISKKYKFNDVHCVNDKVGSKNHDASSVLLKSNVNESKESEEIKKDNLIIKSNLSVSNITKSEGNEFNKPQLFPTDLSCPTVITSNDNKPEKVSNVFTDKRKNSDVLKEQPGSPKKLVQSGTDKSSKEKYIVQAGDTVKLDSSIINDLSQNKDTKDKKHSKTVPETNVDNSYNKKNSKGVVKNNEVNDYATDLSVSQSLRTKLSHTDKHFSDCELVNQSTDSSKSLTPAVSLSAESCDTPSENVVKDSLHTEKESNVVVSVSKSNEVSKISDEVLQYKTNSFHAEKESELVVSQSESKETSKTTDVVPQSELKEAHKIIDSVPKSGLKEACKTTDAISQSESKGVCKITDTVTQSGSKEACKTTEAVTQSVSKEACKTTDVISQSESKEVCKATDPVTQSGSEEAGKTTAVPLSESKEACKTTDAVSESGSKEACKTIDAVPLSGLKEASKTTDAISQSVSKEACKTTDVISQSVSKEACKTTDPDTQSDSEESGKTTDAVPQSGLKEACKATDAVSESGSKETCKTTDRVTQSGSKEACKTTDEVPQSGLKEACKTTDEVPQSGLKEACKTTDAISQSVSKEACKTTDPDTQSGSKEAGKTTDSVSEGGSKESCETIDAIPQSGSKEASKTTDAIPQSESKEASKTTDAVPQSGSKEASKTTDAIPQSGSKEASKTTDAVPQCESKEASKTTDAVPQSGSKEASKTTDAIPQSGSKEASKTTDAVPQCESKEASKTTDAVPQSGSKEASKTTDAVPQSRSKEASKTTDAIPQSGSKEANKTTDAVPQCESKDLFCTDKGNLEEAKEANEISDRISQSDVIEKSRTSDKVSQPEINETNRSSAKELPAESVVTSVDTKEISDIDDSVLISSAAEIKESIQSSSESKKSEDKCPRLKKPDESDSDSKESEAEPPHLKEPSKLESELCPDNIDPPSLKACSKSNAQLKQSDSKTKCSELDFECGKSKVEQTIVKKSPPNSNVEPKNHESSMVEEEPNSVSLSKEREMPLLLDQQKKSDSPPLVKLGEEPSKNHEIKDTVPEITNDTCLKDSTKYAEQKSVISNEMESGKEKSKELIKNESESNDTTEKASEIQNSCEKSSSDEQIFSSNEENGLKKSDVNEDKNISVCSKKEDLPSESSLDESKENKKIKKSVQNDAPNKSVTKCKNLEVNEKSKVPCKDGEELSLPKEDCDDKSDVETENAEAGKKCKKDSDKNCADVHRDFPAEDSESKIESVNNEKNTEKDEGKSTVEEKEIVGDEKTSTVSKAPEKVTPEVPISVETEDVSKMKDELNERAEEAETENNTKVSSTSKSKPSKGRPPKKTPARRSRRGGKSLVVEEDASADCLPADTSKEINKETSDVHCKSSESIKAKQISIKESVTEIEKDSNSEAMYKLKFKIYDLQLNSCLETKFKHPLWDKYVRCYKSRSSSDQPKAKPSPVKSPPKGKASKQPAVNKKPQTAPKPSPPKKPVPNSSKKPSRNNKSEVSTKENFAIPEGFLEILDKASSKGPPGKKRKTSELLEIASSHNSSENESTPRKRSRRIQEQHQKKITELAVEMEREQRMLEQMAKRSKKNKNSPKPVEKVNIKAVSEKTVAKGNSTPTKPRGKGKIAPPVIVEEMSLDSKRTTRKMNSRSKNLTKVTLLYEDESKDSQCSTSRETESKSRRRRRRHGKRKGGFKPWDVSSESSSSTSIEEITEEEEEEPDEPLIFEVNEDEFACEEVDPSAEPVIVKRARTAKKTEVEDASEECINDDTPCQKCGKYDKPEWILLCDKCDKGYHTHCLIPPLMIVPDGDWFCQPCEHMSLCQCLHEELNKLEVILKQKEREALRKQRLAYVGISLDNVLKPEKKEKSDESSKEDKEEEDAEEEEDEEEEKVKVKVSESRRSVKSRHSVEDERNEILYGKRSVRARRKVNYQFKEYDELIFSALQEDMLEVPEEFKAEAGSDADSDKPFTAKVSTRKKRARRFADFDSSDEEDSQDEYQGGSSDSEATAAPSDYSEAQSGSDEWKVVKSSGRKKSSQRKNQTRRRRRRRGGDSSEEDWEDEVVEDEPYRPTTRRAAQKAVSYREISSEEEEEWGAKPKVNKRQRRSSSSGSEASFKKKVSKKKRVRKWGSSESSEESEEEKSMSSSEESDEEDAEDESENEWKINKVEKKEKIEKSTSAKKKVLSSEEEEEDEDDDDDDASTRESAPKKRPKKVVSESEEEEEEESESEEEEDDDDEEEEEEEDKEEKQKTANKPNKIPNVKDKEKVNNTASEKEVDNASVVPQEKGDSKSISDNVKFQPKVLVKKELCSVDIPLDPITPPTLPVTSVVDKALPPKPIRKEVTKMVPSIIPYDKSPPKGGQVPADDVIKEDIRRKDEMSYIPPHSRPPMHLSKQGASHVPPPPGDRIQYSGMLPRNTVPPVRHSATIRPQMPAPTNLSGRPPPSSVVVQHPSRLLPRPRSGVPAPSKAPSIPSSQTVPSTKSDNKPFKSTIMEPFSSIDDENESDDEVPLERIPTASTTTPRHAPYERETEYRPAAKELSSYSYAPPEDKPFPGSYSNLSSFPRPSPLKPSLVETYPNNSSPSKLTPLDTYSQSSSPKGFISLDSYPENKKKKHFYGSSSQEGEPPHRPTSENYQGGEIRFPPEPYPCPQSPSSSFPHRSPPTNQRDPGTPPRLYSQFPDAYAPPRSPEYYQNHQYYASEERIPRPSYQPNYAPQEPPSFVSNPYVATPVPQPNGGFMIDTLLQARSHENEEDALTGVTDIVQYITQE